MTQLSLGYLKEQLETVLNDVEQAKVSNMNGIKDIVKYLNTTKGFKLNENATINDVVNKINSTAIKWNEPTVKAQTPIVSDITSNSMKVTARPSGAKIRFSGRDYDSPKVFTDLRPDTIFDFYSVLPSDPDNFIRESVSGVTRGRTLVDIPGPSTLIKGTKEAGYYGPVNGIITAQEIFEETGITNGTARMTGDITWLKFSHKGVDGKYRTLFVADRHIRHSISWDHINNKGYAYGKKITINGKQYKLRLMKGLHEDPSPISQQYSGSSKKFPGSEWDDLIVDLVPEDSVSNWSEKRTWCQEKTTISNRVRRGNSSVAGFGTLYSYDAYNGGWRPVLEVL